MWYRIAADSVLLVHFAFVLFVALGGLLVFRWKWIAWVHLPIAIYGAAIEFVGFICPLTPFENWLRRSSGEAGYAGDFIGHYITAVLYPAGLTREMQWVLGAGVLLLNVIIYTISFRRRRDVQS